MEQGALEVVDDLIRESLAKKIPQSAIVRLLNVHRLTVRNYIRTRKLQKPSPDVSKRVFPFVGPSVQTRPREQNA